MLTIITKTESFLRWFGNSKIVDKDGNPLIVYHGTAIPKDRFRRQGSAHGCGAFFTPSKSTAIDFAENDHIEDGDKPVVIEVYLSIQNPYYVKWRFDPATYDKDPQSISVKYRDELEALGYDGIIILKGNNDLLGKALEEIGELEIVAFRPEQIKSVENIGSFDPNDPCIYR